MLTKGALEPSDGPALNEEQRKKLRQLKIDTQKRDEAYIRVNYSPPVYWSTIKFRRIQSWIRCARNSCEILHTSGQQLTRPRFPRPGSRMKISRRISRKRCKRKKQSATLNSSKTCRIWNFNFRLFCIQEYIFPRIIINYWYWFSMESPEAVAALHDALSLTAANR